ncbi:MAG: hypothetical protein Q9174_005966 [Haloplaca sp. 1 TL-2023]
MSQRDSEPRLTLRPSTDEPRRPCRVLEATEAATQDTGKRTNPKDDQANTTGSRGHSWASSKYQGSGTMGPTSTPRRCTFELRQQAAQAKQ